MQDSYISHAFKIYAVLVLPIQILVLSSLHSFSQCSFSQYPPGEVCTSANYICGSELNGFTGRLPDSLSVSQLWNGCNGNGVADNIVWFSFTPTQNRVTLCITPSNCTTSSGGFSGVQAGIYSQCRASAALDCTDKVGDFNGKTSRFCLTSDLFIPCEPGYLFIDGYAKSVCDFHIEVIEGIDVVNVNPPDLSTLEPGFISGPDTIACVDKNVPVRYSITPPECLFVSNPACGMPVNLPDDSICFEWKILPSTGAFFATGNNTGQFTDIVFTEAGNYTISAETFLHPFYGGSCGSGGCGSIFEWKVFVKSPDTIVLEPIFICPGDAVSICGTLVTSDSILSCFSGTDNCTVLVQQIISGTNKLNELGIQYICRGDVFTFQGVDYNTDGTYEVVDNADCTLLHRFRIENLDINTSLNPGVSTLDCIQQVIELNGITSSNYPGDVSVQWKNNTGNIISDGINVSINHPGSYIFSASITKGNATCISETSLNINQDIEYPQIEIFKPRFNCLRPKGIITVNSSRTLLNPAWRLPLGNVINDQSFFADSLNVLTGGIYQFSAVGSNGCVIDTTISLEIDFDKPTLELSGEDLTCYKPATTLSFTCDMVYDSVRWIYNGFFQTSIGITYNTSLPGNYSVEVRAASSKCWNDDSKLINEDKIRPQVEVGPDLLWHCNTKSLDVYPMLSTGSAFEYLWQTNNGVIQSDRSSPDITVGSIGTYVLEVLNKNNGCTSNDVFSVNKETNVPQDIIALVSDPFCNGESNGKINIENIIGGFTPYSYYINQTPLTDTQINGLPSGIYTIVAKDNYDCEVSLEVSLSDPPLLEVDLPLEINLAFQENFKMVFETNYPISDIVNVTWKNQKGEIIGNQLQLDYNASINEEVSVEIETINGCKAETRAKIIVDTELKLLIPNIFSPNGDDVNDILFIGKNKIPAEIDQIAVYDRFGNKVYHSTNSVFNEASTGWDGTYGGKKVVPGIYVMILHITDFQGNKKIIRQDITIIH